MSEDFKAIINEKSTRYQEWLAIMGTNEIPLLTPIPQMVALPSGVAPCLWIDIAALTYEQKERMVKHLATKFSIPEQEVAHDLDGVGCPILDEEVTVVIFNPQKWIG
jgi:hypothetical protein